MTYSLKIALRYFFSKSKQTVINRINTFAFFMVVVSTTSLFIVLSAFSGLKDFGLSFSNNFDPDFEILPERGSFFSVNDETLNQIENLSVIHAVAPLIEEKVFLSFKEKSQVAFLKAVSPKYTQVVPLENLIALGDWLSHKGSDVVVGFGIAGNMGLSVYDYNSYLNVTVPKKNRQTLLDQNPFTSSPAIVSGLYQISEDLDKKYVFSSLSFGQGLLELAPSQYSSIVLKTMPGTQKSSFENSIRSFFNSPIRIVSREEQNMALYRMLNIEHLAIYFIFTLVMIIALFNVVGALIMMILDKKRDLKTLFSMGATKQTIQRVFFAQGVLMTVLGGLSGLLLGVVVILLQQHFELVMITSTLAYPVVLTWANVGIAFSTILVLGIIASRLASWRIKKVDFVA